MHINLVLAGALYLKPRNGLKATNFHMLTKRISKFSNMQHNYFADSAIIMIMTALLLQSNE